MTDDTGSTRTTLSWGRGHVRHGRVPEWLLLSDASDRAIRLYAILATYADRDGRAFPGRKRIMGALGCKLTAYKAAVADLARVGALDVEERVRDDGSRTTNRYTLHWDETPPSAYAYPRQDGVATATGDGRGDDRGSAAPATDLRAGDPPPSELKKTPELETLAAGAAEATPPRLTKVGGRDLAFDALAEVCGVDPGGNRAREVGIALNGSKRSGLALGIRALAWRDALVEFSDVQTEPSESWERLLCGYISLRAERYRTAMPGAALTPLALAKWWTDLDSVQRRDPAADAMREAVRLAEEGR